MSFKEKFLANPAASKQHADAVASSWFHEAIQIALLECSSKWAKESVPESGHYKTQGAFEFLEVFVALSRPSTPAVRKDLDNLK